MKKGSEASGKFTIINGSNEKADMWRTTSASRKEARNLAM